tara:strand:- start:373 stop:996 length:624 start_codon:yes stop_codon:yes gene_type:complete
MSTADRSVPTQYHYDSTTQKAEASGSAYAGGDGDLISTGSISLNDGQSLIDSGGDARITFTNAGATIIKDESGFAGITLNTNLTTTFAKSITLDTGTVKVSDGGAVTQGNSSGRATAVTLNKLTGKITGDDASLNAVTIAKHTVTNSTVEEDDVVIVSKVSGDADTSVYVDAVGAGSFDVAVRNNHASDADTTALVYNFVVIKGSNT